MKIFYLIGGLALLAAGCGQRPAAPSAPPSAPAKPAGRLVPAVVASFERGAGGWKAVQTNAQPPHALPVSIQTGGAARGQNWLAVSKISGDVARAEIDVYSDVPAIDWSRFGDTVRAAVRCSQPSGATARLFIIGADGKRADGPDTPLTTSWQTLAWNAGSALSGVTRIGVHYAYGGRPPATLGLDNVRVGAAEALEVAYSVVNGPFPSREAASAASKALRDSGIDSFPMYEQGWYLNLGTFRTHSAAAKEAQRLGARHLKVTVLER